MSNQIGHAPVRLKAATTVKGGQSVRHVTFNTTHRDSKQLRVRRTSSRPSSSVQKKRDIAAAERWRGSFNLNLVCTRQEFNSEKVRNRSSRTVAGQFQPKSGIHPFGWKPGARQQFSVGKTRICSSRTVAGQFQVKLGMHPFGWKPRAKHQFSAGRATPRSSRTVAGQCQIRSGMYPFRWKPRAKQQFSAGQAILRSRRTVAGQCQIRSGMHPFGWKPLQPCLGRSECQTSHI